MNKKVVVIGGGTGLSCLVKGLKEYRVDISAIVSVCDDGRSTGILREEFNQIAVGDIRRVLTALSANGDDFSKLINYRFNTTSNLNGHTLGNLLLTASADLNGNMSRGISSLSKLFNLKGNVIPFSEDNDITLMAKMIDGSIVSGEHNITESKNKIEKVFYKNDVKVSRDAIKAILDADLIILSMGSIYTSVIPNLLSSDIRNAIDTSKADVMYVCNMFTQPGETDNFKASDHINLLNSYLGNKKVSVGIFNNQEIDLKVVKKYETEEQKDLVIFDKENLSNLNIIEDNLVEYVNGSIKHNTLRLGLDIFTYILKK